MAAPDPRRLQDERGRRMSSQSNRMWTGLGRATRASGRLDRVEVKILVPEVGYDALLSELGRQATFTRWVYYLDTPRLDLARQGVVIRARTASRGRGDCFRGDSVVKLRRDGPARLPRGVRRTRNLSVELDALPSTSWWTTAVSRRVRPSVVRDAVRGREPLRTLMSAEQRRFLRALTSEWGTSQSWRDLRVHGPVEVTRSVGEIPGLTGRLELQRWDLPDGSRLTEVSTKCRPSRASGMATAIRRLLVDRGIDLGTEQRSKTGASLAQFTPVPTAVARLAR